MTADTPRAWNSTLPVRQYPLPPGKQQARRAPIRRQSARRAREAAGQPQRRTRRDTGPTPKVRRLVLDRDEYTCQCGCLRSIIGQRYSLGHRKRASQGGRAVPSNLLTFLGLGGEQHHGRIDRRDDPRDEANGMTVRSWQDPAQVPVTVTYPDGSKARKYLWDDGTRRDEPQPEAVAA